MYFPGFSSIPRLSRPSFPERSDPRLSLQSGQGQPTTYQPSTFRFRVCPDCAGPVVRSSGCMSCPQCGWGQCG
jgi:hypothetical protein